MNIPQSCMMLITGQAGFGNIRKLSGLPSQFFYKFKTVLKNKSIQNFFFNLTRSNFLNDSCNIEYETILA